MFIDNADLIVSLGQVLVRAELGSPEAMASLERGKAQIQDDETAIQFQETCQLAIDFQKLPKKVQFIALMEDWSRVRIFAELNKKVA